MNNSRGIVKSARAARPLHGPKRTKRATQNGRSFAPSIYKVLKSVLPQMGISNIGMSVVSSYANDMLQRLYKAARTLAQLNRRDTITSREIQSAVRLILPSELAKHAVMEGVKAVTKYNAANGKGSKAARSGLIFPPSQVEKVFRRKLPGWKLGATATIYAAAVVQYLVTELLELAGNAATQGKYIRITPRQIFLAIRGDEQLNFLLDRKTIITSGGVVPFIYRTLVGSANLGSDTDDRE